MKEVRNVAEKNGNKYVSDNEKLIVEWDWEKNKGVSPYAYCLGNPVKMVDPDGMDEIYYREDGSEISRIKSNKDEIFVLTESEYLFKQIEYLQRKMNVCAYGKQELQELAELQYKLSVLESEEL